MRRVEKSIFLSYRRTNFPWARIIYQNLTSHGYDVFFDFKGIDSGDFESIIIENIKSRAHFLVLLTPSALERCSEPGDWVRREIEVALDTQRNIVPLMLDDFNFSTPEINKNLTGKLSALKRYNAIRMPIDYFDEALQRLRERYLNVPLDAVLHPASAKALEVARADQKAANIAPSVQQHELTAQKWYEQGVKAVANDEKIKLYTQAIRLNPEYAEAYNNRGIARNGAGDLKGAIQDYDQAIRLKPEMGMSYNNRGVIRYNKGDLEGALRDYEQAIRINPKDDVAHFNRGLIRQDKGDKEGAIEDWSITIRINPKHVEAYRCRGDLYLDSSHILAVRDFLNYLDLGGGKHYGDQEEVEKLIRQLKSSHNYKVGEKLTRNLSSFQLPNIKKPV
jgi:tetratricopeptide (TPR) repeat protein